MNSEMHIVGLLPSGSEWLWILALALLLFGGAKLPALARGLGQSIKEFKKSQKDEPEEEKPAAEKKPAEPAKTHGTN